MPAGCLVLVPLRSFLDPKTRLADVLTLPERADLARRLAGDVLDLLQAARELDAARLAATTRVHLRLDHPHRAAQLLCGFDRFVNRECGDAPGHRNVELAQDFLALVFVDLHRGDLLDLRVVNL